MRRRGFPGVAFEELGYNVAVHGQKGFNGVALLSKLPFDEVAARACPATTATSRRATSRPSSRCRPACSVASIYLPNGNPIGTDKFAYKLAWMTRLQERTRDAAGRRGADRPRRRLQRHPRARRRQATRAPGRTTRCSSRRRAPPIRSLVNLGPDRRVARLSSRAPASTPSGTIRPAPSRRTTASASTTCCCRRRRPTAWCRRASIASRAPGRSRRITCRRGSSSTSSPRSVARD